MTKRYLSLFTLALAVLISGCGVSSDESVPPSASPTAGFKVRYAPLGGIVPFPNDLFLNGSTDGTLNIPVADPTDYSNPLVAINALDGYSTTAAIEATFTDAIDAATLAGNQTVFVFKLTATGATPLMEGTDYNLGLSPAADSAGTVLQITPLKPLDPDTSYAVFLTTDIKSSTGANVTADTAFQQIKDAIASGQTLSNATLEQIREQAIEPLIGLATQAGLSSDKIAVAFSFTTQSIGDVLSEIEANVTPQFSQLQDTGLTTQQVLGSASPGIAEIYSGVIQVPYYLSKNSPLSGFWQGAGGSFLTRNNTTPVATETLTIPVLVTVPNAGSGHTKPATGWPTVLFQHGITQDRTNVFAVADALAQAGYAAVAIDLPLHGITDTSSPLYQGDRERTFNLDVENNTTGAAGPDGQIDPSGDHFINLASLLTSRDNLREAAADLMTLAATVPTMDIDGNATNADFDGSQMEFVGHSLGAIAGTTFLGESTQVYAATLGMPGGKVAALLQDSPTFKPRIDAGLQQEGIVAGTQLYVDFFRNAQTVVDSGDPWNYAAAAASSHPIHMIEVVGGAGNPPDEVVPNNSTERLVDAMGLTDVSGTTLDSAGVRGIVRFTAGDHGSLLDPTASAQAWQEMQSEMAQFMGSQGTAIVVTDSSVVQ